MEVSVGRACRTLRLALAAVALLAGASGSFAQAPRESSSLLVPIGCLLSAECWSEHAALSFESEGDGVPVESDEQLAGRIGRHDFLTFDALGDEKERARITGWALQVRDQHRGVDLAETPEQSKEIEQYPNIIGPWPDAVRAEIDAFMASAKLERCEAAYELISDLQQDGDLKKTDGEPASTLDRRKLMVALYGMYLEDCFDKSSSEDDAFLKNLVILFRSNGAYDHAFCAGFRYVGDLIVTARHCLVDFAAVEVFIEDYGLHERTAQIPILAPLPGTKALLLEDPSRSYDVVLPEPPPSTGGWVYNPNVPENDIAILKLVGAPPLMTPYPTATPRQWMQLMLPTVHAIDVTALRSAWVAADGEKRQKLMRSVVLIDRSPNCRIFSFNDPCLFHSCQTRAGFSGSPLLADVYGMLKLVGIHTGAVGTVRAACDFKRKFFFPNYGLRLPTQAGKLGASIR